MEGDVQKIPLHFHHDYGAESYMKISNRRSQAYEVDLMFVDFILILPPRFGLARATLTSVAAAVMIRRLAL